LRSFSDEGLDRILIAQPVTARNCVVRVLVEAVIGFCHPGGPAFGRNGVAAHGINLGDHGDAEFGIDFGGGYGGAETRASSTHEKNIMRGSIHRSPRAHVQLTDPVALRA